MKVVQRNDETVDAWRTFIGGRSDALPFHRDAWVRVLKRGFGFKDMSLLALAPDSCVHGVLPLFYVRRPIGRPVLISAPLAAVAGPLTDGPEAERALLDAALERAEEAKADYLEVRRATPHTVESAGPDWHTIDHYATFRKSLPDAPEAVEGFIPRKQRAEVRKARKRGLRVVRDAGIDRFYPIYARSVHRLGSPVFPRAYAQALVEEFADDCEILTAELDGRPVASVLSLYTGATAFPYHAGGMPLERGVTAYPLLYAAAMERASERGAQSFDFGRSIEGTGAFAFKRNFGFDPTPLTYGFKLIHADTPPDLRPDSPRFKSVVGLWKRLPPVLVDHLGPWLSRQVV